MSLFSSTSSSTQDRGIPNIVYNCTVRPYLPRKWGVLNGVAVRDFKLLDLDDHQPRWKAGFLEAIRECVRPGDTVVDVAAGKGVAAVIAARQGADVVSYEASEERVGLARETVKSAAVDGVRIEHALVGDPIDVWGSVGGVSSLPPSDLPECDLLQLDCEGAEISILEGLTQAPRTVVVETHPNKQVPTEETRGVLESAGYRVEEREYEAGREDGKCVLVGRRATMDGPTVRSRRSWLDVGAKPPSSPVERPSAL